MLGYTSDNKKGVNSEKSKVSKGSVGKGKIGIGPGPQKDVKKGQWTRLTHRPNLDLMEEAPLGAEGLKRKTREL